MTTASISLSRPISGQFHDALSSVMGSRNSQPFHQVYSSLTSLYIAELLTAFDTNQKKTFELWTNLFDSLTMKTILSQEDIQKLHKIFEQMVKNQLNRMLTINTFMNCVKRSMRKRPRVTTHFLRQVLPLEEFKRSLHKYGKLKNIGFILDFFRYVLFAPPVKQFQRQLKQFVNKKKGSPKRTIVLKQEQRIKRTPTTKQSPVPTLQPRIQLTPTKKQSPVLTIPRIAQQKQQQQQQYDQRKLVRTINQKVFDTDMSKPSPYKETISVHDLDSIFKTIQKIKDEDVKDATITIVHEFLANLFQKPQEHYVAFVVFGDQLSEYDYGSIYMAIWSMKKDNPMRIFFFDKTKQFFLKKLNDALQKKEPDAEIQMRIQTHVEEILTILKTTLDSPLKNVLWKLKGMGYTIFYVFNLFEWKLPPFLQFFSSNKQKQKQAR